MKTRLFLMLSLALSFSMVNATGLIEEAKVGYTTMGNSLIVLGIESESGGQYIIDSTYTLSTTERTYVVTKIGKGDKPVQLGSDGFGKEDEKTKPLALTIRANAIISANAFKDWTSLKTLTMDGVTTPPALGENALPESLTKIVVPEGCAEKYATAAGWSAWASIIEDVNGQKATALEEVRGKSVIGVSGRSVTLAEPTRATIYDMTGTKVYDGVATRISLRRSGIYVVKTAKETKRVAVK